MGTWRLKQKNALEKKERGAVHEVCYYIILHIVIHIYIRFDMFGGVGMMC